MTPILIQQAGSYAWDFYQITEARKATISLQFMKKMSVAAKFLSISSFYM